MCTALHIHTVSNLVRMAATSSPNSRMLVDYHGAFSITHEMSSPTRTDPRSRRRALPPSSG
ncbi:hypothetical protein M405DRAFT_813349 [Rhizopogon salebrosus TDB-379]|nr:hypothetical protein M405DRAFT_813349 [Rhizopogon salebrosus TDB-379]